MQDMHRNRLDRRGFLKTTAATALAASFPITAAKAAPKRGGTLRIGLGHGETTDTLNPGMIENEFTIGIAYAIHGRLVEVAPDGSVVPEVAESWESTPDASVWRFKLRSGVTFHSGRPVTAEDVVVSMNFHRGENSTSAGGPVIAEIEDIKIEGRDTIVFELKGGNADFPFVMSDLHLVIVPAKDDMADWQSNDGCGSYMLENVDFGVSAKLVRNPNHWRDDVAWFDSIEVLSIVDVNARTAAMVSGDLDVIDRPDLKTIDLLARNPDIQITDIAGTQHYTFPMSTNKTPYDDNNVRMAMKHAVNRQELVDKILFGYGTVGNDIPIGRNQLYYNTDLPQREYDPEKARWYLKQSGLDGLDIRFPAADAAFPGAVDAALLFQNSAKDAGINIEVERKPNDGYWADVWMQEPLSASYWFGRPVQDQMFTMTYTCGADWNETFFCNDRFEELLVAARAELDTDKRRAMYFEMQEIVHNQGGAIVPMFANYVFATSKKIGKPDVIASNADLDGTRWAERWWFV